jgi:hypothetical protein
VLNVKIAFNRQIVERMRTWNRRTCLLCQVSYGAVPVTARRAKRENGGMGEDPPGSTIKNLTKAFEKSTIFFILPSFVFFSLRSPAA